MPPPQSLWVHAVLVAFGSSQGSTEGASEAQAFRERLKGWAEVWEGRPLQREVLTGAVGELVGQVDFSVAAKYASWAADERCSAGAGTCAVAAVLLEAVALLPRCLEELQSHSELQTRCPQRWYKIAIQKLLSLGEHALAERVWGRARELRTEDGGPAVPWPSVLETPSIWVRGLRSQAFWDCQSEGSWPFVRALEAQTQMILAEARQAAPQLRAAYPYLFAQGSWQNLFLFRGGSWNSEVCAAMPRTCNLLIPEIPTRPGLPFVVPNNEEIVLFRSEPGARVGPHSGAVNNQINIHLTLVGGEGVTLRAGDETRELQTGRAICFQDSFVHSIEHPSCSGTGHGQECPERISLVTRVLHPDWSTAHYGGSSRTDAVEDLATWQTAPALTRELLALREKFRRLAEQLPEEQEQAQALAQAQACEAPALTEPTWQKMRQLFAFLSAPLESWGSRASPASAELQRELEPAVEAIVVLSNWYDRLSKVQKVLELARRHQAAHIVLVGGRGRLSSVRAAELDGEAHATLARLLVLLEAPGGLGAVSSTDRLVTAISCNECPTAEQQRRCSCVGNTGFNTDRFLDWAAAALPPLLERPRHVVLVEESFLVRRVAATVLGRLAGGFGHAHSLVTMEISVLSARPAGEEALEQLVAAHSAMPAAVPHLLAGEVLRLYEYSQAAEATDRQGAAGVAMRDAATEQPRAQALFSTALFLYSSPGATPTPEREPNSKAGTGSGSGSDSGSGFDTAWLPADSNSDSRDSRSSSSFSSSSNSVSLERWAALLGLARELDREWEGPMRTISRDRRIFWHCAAPRDMEAPLWVREASELPRKAWHFRGGPLPADHEEVILACGSEW